MSHTTLSPRSQALLTRVEAWSDAGPVRAVAVKALVTIGGPLVVLAGVAMLVLPGPGLFVIVPVWPAPEPRVCAVVDGAVMLKLPADAPDSAKRAKTAIALV